MQVTALENPEVTARLLAQENKRLKAALREQHQAMVRLAKQARLDAPARSWVAWDRIVERLEMRGA